MLKLGWIEDLANHLAMADIAILPLLSGGGTRNKVLDCLAAGVPIVSTTKGIEGINLKDGKDVIISNDFSSKFVEQIKFIKVIIKIFIQILNLTHWRFPKKTI